MAKMLMYLTYSLSLAAFAVAADDYNRYPTSLGYGNETETGSQVFADANSMPNASNTVYFRHDRSSDAVLSGNWSWTVKVSDVLVPANSSVNPQLSPNAHVAYTTYGFSWPEDGNLNEALQAENEAVSSSGSYSSCAFVLFAQFPANVSRKFDTGSNDSNCTNVLGDDCVRNITAMATAARDCGSKQDAVFLSLSHCASSFGAALGGYGISSDTFGNSSMVSNSSAYALEKGETYAYSLSAPYSPDNLTFYNQAKDNVHVLVLASSETNVLCNRAGNGSSLTGAAAGRRAGLGLSALMVVVALAGMINSL